MIIALYSVKKTCSFLQINTSNAQNKSHIENFNSGSIIAILWNTIFLIHLTAQFLYEMTGSLNADHVICSCVQIRTILENACIIDPTYYIFSLFYRKPLFISKKMFLSMYERTTLKTCWGYRDHLFQAVVRTIERHIHLIFELSIKDSFEYIYGGRHLSFWQ